MGTRFSFKTWAHLGGGTGDREMNINMRLRTFKGGLHIDDCKWLTEDLPIKELPLPKKVRIPINQNFGNPAEPVVKSGDLVKTGQLIAVCSGNISSNVHASISGRVLTVDKFPNPLGKEAIAVEIESDGKDEHAPELQKANPIDMIKEAGIVGMGGAMFPTYIKLQPPKDKKVDTLIINGAECEPYITCDYRLMLEEPDRIISGIKIIAEMLNVKDIFLGIESNKPKAIDVMGGRLKGIGRIVLLKTKYPQGGEKQLIKAVSGREVPSGGLPFEVGAIVQNIATAAAIHDAVVLHKPMYERVVTIAGSCVKEPGNFRLRIGTLVSDIAELADTPEKLIIGGPMMGLAQYTFDVPIIKGTSAVLVFGKKDIKSYPLQPCIRCGKCINACPMGLYPGRLADLVSKGLIEEAVNEGLKDCIECGLCAFVCPSNRDIIQLVKYAKQL